MALLEEISMPRTAQAHAVNVVACLFLAGALLAPIATISVSVETTISDVLDKNDTQMTLEAVRTALSYVNIEIPADERVTYNVFQAVGELFRNAQYLPAFAVAVFSILLPILKMALRIWPRSGGAMLRQIPARLSMLDVLFIAVLVLAASNVSGWEVEVGPAAYFYLAFAALTSLISSEE